MVKRDQEVIPGTDWQVTEWGVEEEVVHWAPGWLAWGPHGWML